ncbi:hypothetical protein [Paracidovorax konjaci]|uniref:Lipoprotein n=1 Tax=Paracidovorax konjaci TaxID=32040 RepID=A0A1I1X6U6_9BURK|nr:hypothetical protein [Paracidovorax konjaci]SFE03135.1 hypothetical protein SAMN04489710_11226 [Paracidovorax konjaci]
MRKAFALFVIAMAPVAMPWAADTSTPAFADCPVAVSPPARRAPVDLANAESRAYATQLRRAAKEPVNFAGHYVLASWGCGAGCVTGGVIDARTGSVTLLPFTVSDWPLDVTEPLAFRKNSCILVVQGSRNETGGGTHFYAFRQGEFQWLKSLPR